MVRSVSPVVRAATLLALFSVSNAAKMRFGSTTPAVGAATLLALVSGARGDDTTIPCTWSPPGHPEIEYDFSKLETGQDLTVAGTEGNQRYFLRVCADTIESTQSCCQSCDHGIVASAVQTWSSAGDSCGALGSLTTASWVLANPSKPAGGAKMSFTGGDITGIGGPQRSMDLIFACDASQTAPLLANPTDDGAGHYTLTVKAKAACPRTPQPLSYGWLAIILGGSAIVAYLVLGIAYNKKVRELDGLDLIPQWSYWQMLPGLVYDGVVFTHANVRWYMHHGQKGVSEYRAHRNNEARPPAARRAASRAAPHASRLPTRAGAQGADSRRRVT